MAAACVAAVCMIGLVGCDQQQGLLIRQPSESSGRLPFSEPAGERWTIECLVDRSQEHVAAIDRLADLMRRTRGINPNQVRVAHGDQASTLYYGYYVRREDPGTGQRSFPQQMNRDIQMIRQLAIDPTNRPFGMARRVLQTAPDEGPADWDLRSAKGYYSLQIGVFYNLGQFQDRKKAAVDYCRYWREKGYDAFYYHGPTRSSTTVGTFPESAVQDLSGIKRYAPEVRALQGKEPEFAWNLENGHKIYVRREGRRLLQGSVLIRIPSQTESSELPAR